MNGFKHARLVSGLTQKEISKLTGIHPVEIVTLERDGKEAKCTKIYLLWSDATHVPIDDLLKTYPDDEDLHIFSALSGKDENIVYRYAKERRLTCRELGKRMGISHELARQLCSRDPAEKYLESLAEYEGLSVNEFLEQYGGISRDL